MHSEVLNYNLVHMTASTCTVKLTRTNDNDSRYSIMHILLDKLNKKNLLNFLHFQ